METKMATVFQVHIIKRSTSTEPGLKVTDAMWRVGKIMERFGVPIQMIVIRP